MKTRLGLLVFAAVLAGCSAQDNDTKSAQQAVDSTLGTNAKAISGIAQYARDSKRSIGSAPDRGELFTYRPGATALHEGAYTLRPVSLSEEHAIRAAVTGVMAIPGPDGKDIKIAYERHEEHPDGNWSWIGRVIGGDQAQEAIFTFGQDAVFGSIPQANGPSLKLTTQRGIAYLMQADASRLFRGKRAGNDVKVAAYKSNMEAIDATGTLVEMAMAKAHTTSNADVSTKAITPSNTVDLVAGYSNGLAARLGSDGAAVTRLNQLVVAANQALLNSKISARIRLVGAVKVNYADNTDNGTALDQLTGSDGDNAVTVPAALAPLRAARETTGADLVTLVRDFQSTNNGCGIAWLLGANGEAIVPGSDAPFGYSIVSDGDYDLNGNTYFCEDITLIHELAHNMGSAHDIENAAGTPGRFPYSYGYKTTAAAGNFFTVMAYGDDNQTLYRVFSNPAISTCGTRACGVANAADNARSLNQTVPVVATFRAAVVPFEGYPNLQAIKKQGASGFTELHTLSSSNEFQGYSRNLATALATTGVDRSWEFQFGDYNADSVADLYAVKKIGASGKTEVHVMNGKTGFKTYLLNVATVQANTGSNGRWEFRLGDYNGDGKLDLYGIDRTGASGKTEVHVLNGADRFQSYLLHSATALGATGVDDAWKFELGKYNSDTKLDIYAVKKNGPSGRTEVHILNGSNGFKSFLLNKATALGASGANNLWDFKVGDYDLDGKPDLYGIKKVGGAGKTEVHILNGSDAFQTFALHKSTVLGNTGTDSSWEFVLSQ